MTKPDEKRGPFRQPKVKTLGLRVPSLPSPHEAFIPQSEAPALSSPVPGAPPQGEPAHSALLQDAQAQDAPAKTPLVQASPSQSRKDAPLRGSVRHTAPDAQDSVLPVTPVPSTPVHQPMGAKPREELEGNWFKMPNAVFDGDGLKGLSLAARVIYYRLLRQTLGHNRPTCTISNAKICERDGLSPRGVQLALTQLVAFGLVERLGADLE